MFHSPIKKGNFPLAVFSYMRPQKTTMHPKNDSFQVRNLIYGLFSLIFRCHIRYISFQGVGSGEHVHLRSFPENIFPSEAMTHWHLKRVGTSSEVGRVEGWMPPMVSVAFSNDFCLSIVWGYKCWPWKNARNFQWCKLRNFLSEFWLRVQMITVWLVNIHNPLGCFDKYWLTMLL